LQPRRKRQKKNKTAMNMVGALLAHFRIRAALTQQELAERLCMSADKVASMEQGRRPLHIVDAEHIDKVLNTTGALAAAVGEMPEQENIPLWSVTLMENEQQARSFHSYEPRVVPGLLQTEEYARAVLGCAYPPFDEEKFERRFRNRMERQQLLQRTPPPAMSHVIDESALLRPVGGRECLRRQTPPASLGGPAVSRALRHAAGPGDQRRARWRDGVAGDGGVRTAGLQRGPARLRRDR
jgi:transcriptional regulator with XRE-family HTH domain